MSSRMKILEGSQSEIRILAIGAITENFTVNLKFTSENIGKVASSMHIQF